MAGPKKYKNFKVLSVSDTGTVPSKRKGKDVPKFEVVLQGVDDPAVILNGDAIDPQEGILVKDNVIEDVWVYENVYDGKPQHSFFFPSKKGSGDGAVGGKTWQGGTKDDVELKLVSFAMSYAKDLFMNTPEATLDGMFETANKIFDKMNEMYKRAKG